MSTPPIHQNTDNGIDKSRLQLLLGWQVTRAELHLHRKFIEHLTPFSLRPVDFFILLLISSNQGINQRQIGDTLGLSPPNLVNVITRLIKKRLIRRVRGRHDRRIQHLHLTPGGHECLTHSERVVSQVEQKLTEKITVREQATLKNALQHLVVD